jgi:hypothetical protein
VSTVLDTLSFVEGGAAAYSSGRLAVIRRRAYPASTRARLRSQLGADRRALLIRQNHPA